MAKVLWPETHFHLRKGFMSAASTMNETAQHLEFARVYFSAASLREAPGVPADVNVEQLACCVQGAVLRTKSEFEPGPHLPPGFPQLDGQKTATHMVELICRHFGLSQPGMHENQAPRKRAAAQTGTCKMPSSKKASITKPPPTRTRKQAHVEASQTRPSGPWPDFAPALVPAHFAETMFSGPYAGTWTHDAVSPPWLC